MLPRERVMRALEHQNTDRVPLDFWATPEMWEKLQKHFGTTSKTEVLEHLCVDIRDYKPLYVGEPCKVLEDGSFFEPMGTHRRIIKNEYNSYDEYASFPLAYAQSVEDLECYQWFDADDYDYAGLSDQIGNTHKNYAIKMMVGGLFELAWALRGYEQFLMDIVLNPEIAHFIMKKIADFYCVYIERAMEHAGEKIDIVFSYDDIASQRSMLMSTDMWEKMVKPYHIQMNRVIKKYNKKILYHTCGNIYKKDILDGLIEMGIDVLNPIQMCGDMTWEELKAQYGEQLCFHGGVDIQKVLPFYTVDQIKAEVDQLTRIMGQNGGLILASTHFIQNDTPVENVIAMYGQAAASI